MRLFPILLISSLLALASGEVNPHAQAKMTEFFESPDMESFVDYLHHLAAKQHRVSLPEDERAPFNSCRICQAALGAFVGLYDALPVTQDEFNELIKVCQLYKVHPINVKYNTIAFYHICRESAGN